MIDIDESSGRALRIVRVDEPGPARETETEAKIDNGESNSSEQP